MSATIDTTYCESRDRIELEIRRDEGWVSFSVDLTFDEAQTLIDNLLRAKQDALTAKELP